MTPEVQQAIRELQEAFSDERVVATPDEEGGADVIVKEVSLGERFTPASVWIGFRLSFQYPNSDVYPHFVTGKLKHADGSDIGRDGISGPVEWRAHQALQLSRKSNRWNPATDTALLKLLKVVEWLKAK